MSKSKTYVFWNPWEKKLLDDTLKSGKIMLEIFPPQLIITNYHSFTKNFLFYIISRKKKCIAEQKTLVKTATF